MNCKQLGATHATLDMSEPEPAAASAVAPARTLVRRIACAEMLSGLAALSFCHGVTTSETLGQMLGRFQAQALALWGLHASSIFNSKIFG